MPLLRCLAIAALAALSCGCGDGDVGAPAAPTRSTTTSTSTDATACEPGTWAVDETCRPAGVPADTPMPPPFVEPEAGVPADGCEEGFVADGDSGCEPVLPAGACPPGQLAIPGETACHEPAPCAPGTWGDIPVDAGTVYVDAAYGGADADGSAAHPFPNVQLAVDAAPDGATVAVAAGTYNGQLVVTKPGLRIWGRCPALVALIGPSDDAAVRVTGAPGVELRSLAIAGGKTMIRFGDSPGGRVDRAWLHGSASSGVWVAGLDPPVVISETLVEHASGGAVVAYGGGVRVERSLLRDTNPYPSDGTFGHGVVAVLDLETNTRSHVEVVRSVVERNREVGVFAGACDVDVVGSVIRDQQVGTDGTLGAGALAYTVPETGDRASLAVRGSVIEGTVGAGIRSDGSDVIVERTVVRAVAAAPVGGSGDGIVSCRGLADATGDLTVRESLVEQTLGHGASALGSKLRLEHVRIRDVHPSTGDLDGGQGVFAESVSGVRSDVALDGCVVERARTYAIDLFTSDATVARTALRDIGAGESGYWGGGIEATDGSTVELSDSLVERVRSAGLVAWGSNAAVERSILRQIDLQLFDGRGGGGMFVTASPGESAELVVADSLVESVHTAGIAAVDARIVVERTLVRDVAGGSLTGEYGAGIHVERDDPTVRRDLLEAGWVSIEGATTVGLTVLDADGVLAGVSIADVEAAASTGADGGGFAFLGSLARPSISLDGCRVARVESFGVATDGADLSVSGLLVQDVAPAPDGRFGRGLSLQEGSLGTLDNSRVERTHDFGVLALDSSLTLTGVTVRDTKPRASDGSTGDGAAIEAQDPSAKLVLTSCRIEGSARAGVSAFGSAVELTDTVLECNPIALDAERSGGREASFVDGGGNVCGCAGEIDECRVLSASLAPPEALDH